MTETILFDNLLSVSLDSFKFKLREMDVNNIEDINEIFNFDTDLRKEKLLNLGFQSRTVEFPINFNSELLRIGTIASNYVNNFSIKHKHLVYSNLSNHSLAYDELIAFNNYLRNGEDSLSYNFDSLFLANIKKDNEDSTNIPSLSKEDNLKTMNIVSSNVKGGRSQSKSDNLNFDTKSRKCNFFNFFILNLNKGQNFMLSDMSKQTRLSYLSSSLSTIVGLTETIDELGLDKNTNLNNIVRITDSSSQSALLNQGLLLLIYNSLCNPENNIHIINNDKLSFFKCPMYEFVRLYSFAINSSISFHYFKEKIPASNLTKNHNNDKDLPRMYVDQNINEFFLSRQINESNIDLNNPGNNNNREIIKLNETLANERTKIKDLEMEKKIMDFELKLIALEKENEKKISALEKENEKKISALEKEILKLQNENQILKLQNENQFSAFVIENLKLENEKKILALEKENKNLINENVKINATLENLNKMKEQETEILFPKNKEGSNKPFTVKFGQAFSNNNIDSNYNIDMNKPQFGNTSKLDRKVDFSKFSNFNSKK